ncbi:MAG: hypothetical protein FH758_10295 [Firmicutes bacterium]|nr:hypothetical protein [Bacillota bacterium]
MMRKDWIEVEFKLLFSYVIGGDWGKSLDYVDDEYETVYCIRGAEFKNWKEEKGKTASLRKVKRNSLKKRELAIGDILLEISGGGPDQPVGRTVLIDNSVFLNLRNHKIICTNFLRLLRPVNFLNSKWINTYLSFLYIAGKTIQYQGGSNNLRNLKYKQFQTIRIPLAPLPEQRAVVVKVEQLFSELDNGIANLEKAKEKLEIYRHAVLKKAFEGELTKEWRKKQTNVPSPVELLEQIKEERLKHYENRLQEWENAVKEWEEKGKAQRKPKKPRVLDTSVFSNYDKEFFTPKEWTVCQVADVISDLTDYHANGSYKVLKENVTLSDSPDNAIMVRATNFEKDDFEKDLKYINEHAYNFLSKSQLFGGEILIGKIGNAGKVYLMPKLNKKASLAMNLFAIRTDLISSKFLYYQLKNFYQEKEISFYVRGVGNPTIDKISVRSVHINLCSNEEQFQIVKEIETRLSVCDNILANIDKGLEKAEALRQSILKKAFEGRLLNKEELQACRKESDWQPTEKLLSRIKKEKE